MLPLLDIGPPDNWAPIDEAQDRLHDFAWAVFTSPNSVTFFCDRLFERGLDARAFARTRIAAVGLATASALRKIGLVPDLVPQLQTQDGLQQAFAAIDLADCDILFPTSSIGRTHLVQALTTRGARVEHVSTYANRLPTDITIPPILNDDTLDLAIFASPSSVHNFYQILGPERTAAIFAHAHIACIGPTTTTAAQELGLNVEVQPVESSIPALVEAICTFYSEL